MKINKRLIRREKLVKNGENKQTFDLMRKTCQNAENKPTIGLTEKIAKAMEPSESEREKKIYF